jgi:hypothetical protein
MAVEIGMFLVCTAVLLFAYPVSGGLFTMLTENLRAHAIRRLAAMMEVAPADRTRNEMRALRDLAERQSTTPIRNSVIRLGFTAAAIVLFAVPPAFSAQETREVPESIPAGWVSASSFFCRRH